MRALSMLECYHAARADFERLRLETHADPHEVREAGRAMVRRWWRLDPESRAKVIASNVKPTEEVPHA